MVYVLGALLLKRASDLGADLWRTARICNFTTAAIFMPLFFLGGVIPEVIWWWQPALVGLLFVLGQVLTLLSLRIGDVSVATPVMGIKIILVALLTVILTGEQLRGSLWIAAVLSSAAIGLLHISGAKAHHRTGATVLMAGSAATAYALFDVLVQKWSPSWGVGRFLPFMMGFVTLFSFALRPFGGTPAATPRPGAAAWVAGGAFCFGMQGFMITSAIALYGHATVANVLYSSRGLWSVLAVWCAGHWFVSREQQHGGRVLAWRLVGAILLMAAIAIVFIGR